MNSGEREPEEATPWNDLVRACLEGNGEAWDRFCLAARAMVLPFYRRVSGNRLDAEDDCQEFLMRLLEENARRLRAFNPNLGVPFSRYLLKLAANFRLDRLRTAEARDRLRWIDLDTLQEFLAGAGRPTTALDIGRMLDAVESLPPRERTVLRLRVFGLRYEEIARTAGLSQESVTMLLHRGRRRLRGILDRVSVKEEAPSGRMDGRERGSEESP